MQIAQDARLADRLRHAPWMDEPGRTAAGFTVVDRIALSRDVGLLLVAPTGLPQRWYAVLADGGGTPVEASPTFDALVIDGMRRRRDLASDAGGRVVFDGDPGPFHGMEPFAAAWSSNQLTRVRLGGSPFVHKRYRLPSATAYEPEALRRVSGTGCLPDYAGGYTYVSPDGRRFPLGVLYRYVDGEPLEELLRAHLRGVLAAGSADGDLAAIRPVLDAVGSMLGRLHRALAEPVTDGGAFDPGRCVAETASLAATVLDQLRADDGQPPPVRAHLADRLRRAVTDLPALLAAAPDTAAGICHGDLHLAQLLCARPSAEWTARAIDPDPPALDPADPAFADQLPWQDLVALRRSIESFAAHEAAVETARVLGADRRDVIRSAVGRAVGDHASEPVSERLFAVAADWTERVLAHVRAAYAGPPPARALRRALYLRRMLHELAFNYGHRRAYQVNVDLLRVAGLAVTA